MVLCPAIEESPSRPFPVDVPTPAVGISFPSFGRVDPLTLGVIMIIGE